ncbi:hypothetical protein G8V03_14340 [Clostridium botulinum D/C]|uniref:hypothetical protein n=1 Tax=Clostridium botulinum TaxID=1491 RepID=UPI001E401B79|nr:hypothetical protein [Clostridium botulinum]MCD3352138.1 hypothetical protein [Clostridium botulinum D/C]MCD3361085.1 hypothetical protein [Clostridium botulinum D/C]MCD3363980.1 hypothetical protein [Clostridium botulinum D/C]MCD3366843.1 hypothetical protein [Clostridium botulinum D/C]
MILNLKDIKFLKDLYVVKYLNTTRILKLFSQNNEVYIRRRLKMFVDNKYIKVYVKLPSRENVYIIAKKGLAYLGYKPNKQRIGVEYSLAFGDFYFATRAKNHYIKFNNTYYFKESGKKGRNYILNIDILFKISRWIFILFDLNDRALENTLKKINLYYQSKNYLKLFEKFPVVLIISNDIENSKTKVEDYIDLNRIYVQFKPYEHFKSWSYNYGK